MRRRNIFLMARLQAEYEFLKEKGVKELRGLAKDYFDPDFEGITAMIATRLYDEHPEMSVEEADGLLEAEIEEYRQTLRREGRDTTFNVCGLCEWRLEEDDGNLMCSFLMDSVSRDNSRKIEPETVISYLVGRYIVIHLGKISQEPGFDVDRLRLEIPEELISYLKRVKEIEADYPRIENVIRNATGERKKRDISVLNIIPYLNPLQWSMVKLMMSAGMEELPSEAELKWIMDNGSFGTKRKFDTICFFRWHTSDDGFLGEIKNNLRDRIISC